MFAVFAIGALVLLTTAAFRLGIYVFEAPMRQLHRKETARKRAILLTLRAILAGFVTCPNDVEGYPLG